MEVEIYFSERPELWKFEQNLDVLLFDKKYVHVHVYGPWYSCLRIVNACSDIMICNLLCQIYANSNKLLCNY